MNSTSIILNIQGGNSEIFRKIQPTLYNLNQKNKSKNFLILLNSYLLSKLDKEETFQSVAHEILHFIEKVKNIKMSYEEIEEAAIKVVFEFKDLNGIY